MRTSIGIGDMALYIPSPIINLDTISENRARTHPELERRLQSAIRSTGQESFRFPDPWEDTASMAANAAARLLDGFSGNGVDFRYIAVGTETAVDHSKPVSSYVQGMLQSGGYPIGHSLTNFEVKHACAGGTTAVLSTAALLGYSGNPDDKALAICSDISRYDAPSTAEITQGSGAVAMVIERNPRLLELDMDQHGYYASDVDDFFRPLDSVTAKVKGRYSMECYQEALVAAFTDYCRRRGGTPCQLVDEVDYLALHVPFVRMPESALRKLLSATCGKSSEEVENYLTKTRFLDVMDFNRKAGNLYTGSLYAYIMSLLTGEYERLGDGIVGKKILIASYGSGNTMIVFTATIAPGAPKVIAGWDLAGVSNNNREASFDEYLSWLARPTDLPKWQSLLDGAKPEPGQFYLSGFGDTGLRHYRRG